MPQDPDDDGAGRWPTKLRVALLLVGVLIGAIAAPMIYAQVVTNEYQIGEGATYVAPDGLEITAGENVTTNRQHPFPDNQTVDFGPEAEFSADGNAEATVSGLEGQWLVLDSLDVSSNELRVRPDDQSDVNVAGAATRLEVNSVTLDDGQADLRVTTSGETTLDVWDLPADTVVLAVDADTGDLIETVETDGDGSGTFTVSSTRDVEFVSETTAPTIANTQPADGATVGDYEINLSADVTDPDFGETWGDNVTVVFHDVDDGTEIHNETIGANGTVTTTWSGLDMGANTWNVTATDEYGNSVSEGPFTVETPNQLEIRDETTQELIDDANANVTVRFFPTDEEDERIVSRSTDDGTMNLTGIPTDQDIIVDVEAEGYFDRSIIIRNVIEQRTVYLLDENASVVSPTFQIQDRTGDFPSDDSRLIIRRPLESGEEEATYRTILGDTFGADERVSPRLEDGARYRILVESPDGQVRSFGSYVAETAEVVTLDIGQISIGPPGDVGYVFSANMHDDGESIRLAYRDEDAVTSSITITIYEQHNESNVIFGPETTTDPTQYQETVPVPNGSADVDRWVVEYEIDRDGETIEGQTIVGDIGELDLPVDSTVLQTVGLFGILLIAGLFGGTLSRTGAVVVVVVAWLLAMVGVVTIPWPALFAAGSIAFLFKIAEGGGLGVRPV